MVKLNNTSVKDIIEELGLVLKQNDIRYFCNNLDVIKEFEEMYTKKSTSLEELEEFLVEHEGELDKENLVLLMALNYAEALVDLEKQKENLSKKFSKNSQEVFVKLANLQIKIKNYEEKLTAARRIGKGMQKYITLYYYDEEQKRCRVYVIDSREVMEGRKFTNPKNIERFDEIDQDFKQGDEESYGLEYVIQLLKISDLRVIFPDERFGDIIKTMILENKLISNGIKTIDELQELKDKEDIREYIELMRSSYSKDMLPDVKAVLKEYAKYIDLEKLLLVSAYRFNEYLETEKDANTLNVRNLLEGILDNIEDRRAKISCELEIEKDGICEMKKIEYSVADINKCLRQFTMTEYLTNEKVEEYREKVNNCETSLLDLPAEYSEIIFSQNELEQLSILSEDNLLYVSNKLNWNGARILSTIKSMGSCTPGALRILIKNEKVSEEELIDLYEADIISAEVVKGFGEIIDLSSNINFYKLNEYYNALKQNPKNEELQDKYNKYINLYKTVCLTDKSEEKIQEASNFAMEEIIETFEGKEYNKAIKEYYRSGIITLDSIAEWSNKSLITELYEEGMISLQDVEGVVQRGNLTSSYISEIYEQAIWDSNLSEEQRVSILSTGLVSKQVIEALYRKTLISNEDLKTLTSKGVIEENERKRIIESLGMEEAEANSTICLSIDNNIQKIQNKERDLNETSYNYGVSQRKEKIIISPNARDEFFRLLGAKRVQTSKIDANSPFFNYQFYAILGEDGKLHLDSPIIAERYFEEKENERKFATENATYFFQYRDLMVLSNYTQKDEVVSKKENAVFRSSHTIANEKRKGNWASSVIGNVVRTMLSSDLKEYNDDNQKLIILSKIREMYSVERIQEILKLENEIDSGKHLYGIVKENSKVDTDGINIEDTDDGSR